MSGANGWLRRTRDSWWLALAAFGCVTPASAAPGPERVARALVIAWADVRIPEEVGAAPGTARAELDRRLSAWTLAKPGPGRWFADLALADAERRWSAQLDAVIRAAPDCAREEGDAWNADLRTGLHGMPRELYGPLWERALAPTAEPVIGAVFAADPDLSRRLSPEAHAVLGRIVGGQEAGIDAIDELRLALAVPNPSPWTRLRYVELLRSQGEAALAQDRRVLEQAPTACLRTLALRGVAENRSAPAEERASAAAELSPSSR